MKAKFFNYVVHSRGRSVKGSFTSKLIIDVRRMTQLAAWSAQEAAYEEGWEFDLMNFSVAIHPVYEVNTCSQCGFVKPEDEFDILKRGDKQWRRGKCLECRSQESCKAYEDNPDPANKRARKRREVDPA